MYICMYTCTFVFCMWLHLVISPSCNIIQLPPLQIISFIFFSLPFSTDLPLTPWSSREAVDWKVSRLAAGEPLTLRSQACYKNNQTFVGGLWVPATWQECVQKYSLSWVKHHHRLLLAPVLLICPPTHGKALSRNHAPLVSMPCQALLIHLNLSLCLG